MIKLRTLTAATPQWVHRRRAVFVRKLRKILYWGQDVPCHNGRFKTWMVYFAVNTARRYFRFYEMRQMAEQFADLMRQANVPQPPSYYDREYDLDLLRSFEKFTRDRLMRERRWLRKHRIGPETYLRRTMEEHAIQALLDQLCPWCGADLPCVRHEIGRVVVERGPTFRQIESVPSCSSPASPAVVPPPRRSASDA